MVGFFAKMWMERSLPELSVSPLESFCSLLDYQQEGGPGGQALHAGKMTQSDCLCEGW